MKILLSGFDPFADLAINSSQAIVEEIERRSKHGKAVQLTTEILPTVYGAAEERMRSLIREIRPDVILCLGVADSRSEINLERTALNCDHEATPDNAGEVRLGQQIADGPSSYRSTLPLEEMHSALEKGGIPVIFSDTAGTYVCNHVFYSALHEVERLDLDAKCGFIHVPVMDDKQRRGLPLEMMVSAIESCLDVIVSGIIRATPYSSVRG
jgi:pyroglutamyl-peptidase